MTEIIQLLLAARKKGTDKQYREWIQKQPSCISGKFSEWVNGEGRNPACHVRRAGKSGIGCKAKYSCIPLTHDEHAIQHEHGEKELLLRKANTLVPPIIAKEHFDAQRIEYLKRWINS